MASRNEGRTIGAYRIIEQVGVGGMATVYKAFQPSMERYVAIKILPTHHAQDPQFVERFIREARTIAKLEHKNILPVYDFGEEDGTTYLVMRYLEGGTLKDIMAQGRLGLSDIGNIISQMCSALDYAHRQGVIHRDVKPANVIIDGEGESYLTDFGIAKALGGQSDLTGTGVAIGTPAYMAPEQSLGKGVDARTDIYALGVLLYEMVVGKAPYAADTPMAVALAHIHEPLALPRKIDPDIPEGVENVIIKALAKEPADRYQSTSKMSAAFNEAISVSVLISDDSTLLNLVTEVITVRAAQVISEPTMQEAPVEEVEEKVVDEVEKVAKKEPKPKSRRGLWLGLGAVLVIALISIVAFGVFGDRFLGGEDTSATESAMQIIQDATDSAATKAAQATSTPNLAATENIIRLEQVATDRAATQTAMPTPTTTFTPTPTFTSTPRPTTESGLTIYDNFDDLYGFRDLTNWEWNTNRYFVEDGVLRLNLPFGLECCDITLKSVGDWALAPVGSIRLSIEGRMRVSNEIRLSNVWIGPRIQVNGPDNYEFFMGYQNDNGVLRNFCHLGLNDLDDWISIFVEVFGYPRADEWHVLRMSIEERLDSDDLAIAWYIDGEQVCYTIPPIDWQNAFSQTSIFYITLGAFWQRPWDRDSEYVAQYDDIAVYPFEE